MPSKRTSEYDLKTEVDFVPPERTLICDLKTEVDFSCRADRTLRRDLKTEVDFSCHAKRTRLWKSTLDCHVKRTLDAATVVDFAPHGVDLR
jgi:hypothetical protein